MPYWSEQIKPLKDKALFWHLSWLECGKRNSGVVYDVMRRARHKYHYAVRPAAKHNDMQLRKESTE